MISAFASWFVPALGITCGVLVPIVALAVALVIISIAVNR